MAPIKLYEGLSLGVPIVCTDLEGAREIGQDCINYAAALDEHLQLIRIACAQDSFTSAHANSLNHQLISWQQVTELFMRELNIDDNRKTR